MSGLLFALVAVNALVYLGGAVWAVRTARSEVMPRARLLAWVLAVVALAFVVGAVGRLVLLAAEQGWIDVSLSSLLTSPWQLVQTLAALVLAVVGFTVVRRMKAEMREAEQIIDVLSDRVTLGLDLSAFGLTPRELEVVATIAEGSTSDRELAERLHISPATAGTHVKNILRKTGVKSRRDLALLAVAPASQPRTRSR